MSKKTKSLAMYCRIGKYLEEHEPLLYEVLDDTCVLGAIKPRKGMRGVTYIIPSGASIKDISVMRYDGTKFEECIALNMGHIILDYLPKPADWWTNRSDIPDGRSKKVMVEKVAGDKVFLQGGVELELETGYKPIASKSNSAVYRIVKGAMKLDSKAQQATFENARVEGQQRPMRGGNLVNENKETVDKAFEKIKQEYQTTLNAAPVGDTYENPIADYAAGLATHLISKGRQDVQKFIHSPASTLIFLLYRDVNDPDVLEWCNATPKGGDFVSLAAQNPATDDIKYTAAVQHDITNVVRVEMQEMASGSSRNIKNIVAAIDDIKRIVDPGMKGGATLYGPGIDSQIAELARGGAKLPPSYMSRISRKMHGGFPLTPEEHFKKAIITMKATMSLDDMVAEVRRIYDEESAPKQDSQHGSKHGSQHSSKQ